MTRTKRAIICRIQADRPDINKVLLVSVFLIDSSSYKWATVTEEPPRTQPLIGFWISEERKGSSPFKPSQDKLQQLKWQTGCLYICSMLFPSCFILAFLFVPPVFLLFIFPPSFSSSFCFDAVWQQLPLGEAPLIPTDSWDIEDSRTSQNQQTWSQQVLSSVSLPSHSLSPSFFPFSLLWFIF